MKNGKYDELVDSIKSGEARKDMDNYFKTAINTNWRLAVTETFNKDHASDFCLFNYPSYSGKQEKYKKEDDEDVFVYACYAPVGRHQVFIKDPVTDSIFSQHLIVHMKEEETKSVPINHSFDMA
jgi:hypothetical protein